MIERVRGTVGDKTAWAGQMRTIYERFPDGLVIGSFGRAAMYAAYGWQAKPVNLRYSPREIRVNEIDVETSDDTRRDIDLIGARYMLDFDADCLDPYPVDQRMDIYMVRTEDPAVVELEGISREETLSFQASAELFTPRTRILDGVLLRTPLVGVQQQIESIVGVGILPPEQQAKYNASQTEFDEFAAYVHTVAPQEFLPDSVMAPLVELAVRNAW
ncbi:MAG TPA: hypothetical protein VLF62_04500 [Candidatus Saccharimonadales bacterium]|nr:hypothetical protein [Candidatus Saccharimonadales bacterium]